MSGSYRALNFDLDTKKMKEVLGSKTKGYQILRKELKLFGFSHRMGSGYRSDSHMTRDEIFAFTVALAERNLWLSHCVKVFDITNSGKKDYSFADVIKNSSENTTAISAEIVPEKSTKLDYVGEIKSVDSQIENIDSADNKKHQLSPELLALARNAPKTNKEPLVLPRQKSKPDCNENF